MLTDDVVIEEYWLDLESRVRWAKKISEIAARCAEKSESSSDEFVLWLKIDHLAHKIIWDQTETT